LLQDRCYVKSTCGRVSGLLLASERCGVTDVVVTGEDALRAIRRGLHRRK